MITLLNEAVVIGVGLGFKLSGINKDGVKDHTVDISFVDVNASITALIVDLEGTIDGDNISDANAIWFQMDRHAFLAAELTAKKAMFQSLNIPVCRVRANITTLTGEDGVNDLITVRYQPGAN